MLFIQIELEFIVTSYISSKLLCSKQLFLSLAAKYTTCWNFLLEDYRNVTFIQNGVCACCSCWSPHYLLIKVCNGMLEKLLRHHQSYKVCNVLKLILCSVKIKIYFVFETILGNHQPTKKWLKGEYYLMFVWVDFLEVDHLT